MGSQASAEGLARKERSEKILAAQGVPLNKALPAIESENEIARRTVEEIAYRALALITVAMRGEGMDKKATRKIIEDYGLAGHLTPTEKAFVDNEAPSDRDRAQFYWRYEAACTLMWALGYVERLGKPDKQCPLGDVIRPMKQRTAQKFIADAKLRPLAEIVDQADLIYRYRWAIVDAPLANKPAPAGLDPDVALERHVALTWLVGYMDQAWDDISTDT